MCDASEGKPTLCKRTEWKTSIMHQARPGWGILTTKDIGLGGLLARVRGCCLGAGCELPEGWIGGSLVGGGLAAQRAPNTPNPPWQEVLIIRQRPRGNIRRSARWESFDLEQVPCFVGQRPAGASGAPA